MLQPQPLSTYTTHWARQAKPVLLDFTYPMSYRGSRYNNGNGYRASFDRSRQYQSQHQRYNHPPSENYDYSYDYGRYNDGYREYEEYDEHNKYKDAYSHTKPPNVSTQGHEEQQHDYYDIEPSESYDQYPRRVVPTNTQHSSTARASLRNSEKSSIHPSQKSKVGSDVKVESSARPIVKSYNLGNIHQGNFISELDRKLDDTKASCDMKSFKTSHAKSHDNSKKNH